MNDFAADAETDLQLLRRYADQGDQEAFCSLVERYSGLIYGTAMRKTGNSEWSIDITQNVFAALGSKALKLVKNQTPSLGAWLHQAATLEAKRHLRDQLTAQRHNAMIHHQLVQAESQRQEEWEEALPRLDEALERLSPRDRDILILHYFNGMSFVEIAHHLGLRSEAAQKRSARALQKLSGFLRTSNKPAFPATCIATGLTAELGTAAPPCLVSSVFSQHIVAAGGVTLGATLTTLTIPKLVLVGSTIGCFTFVAFFYKDSITKKAENVIHSDVTLTKEEVAPIAEITPLQSTREPTGAASGTRLLQRKDPLNNGNSSSASDPSSGDLYFGTLEYDW